MGFWGWFYFLSVMATLFHSLVPIIPRRARHQTLGAEIIAVSWFASLLARHLTGDDTPTELYAGIDLTTGGIMLVIAQKKRAIWAAVCVLLHCAMGVLHLAYFIGGEVNPVGYIWILNSLFLTSLIAINLAIFAGRHEWGERIDELFVARFRGWSWTGLRTPRILHH